MAVARREDEKTARDLEVLCEFVQIWCEDQHADRPREPWNTSGPLRRLLGERPPPVLCPECTRELGYALGRRLVCPHDPKPACKHCQTQCYSDRHRELMRTIMRYSGKRLIFRGRFDLIRRYLF